MRRLVFILFASAVFTSARADLTIVADGKSDYVVRIPQSASTAEQLAASELSRYVEQITGVELPIQRGKGTAPALIVCEFSHLRQLVGALGMRAVEGEEYFLPRSQSPYITGGRGRSTLLAVYDVLESAGCRFLAPEFGFYHRHAECIPQLRTLTIPEGPNRPCTSKLSLRKLYVEEGHSHTAENLKQMIEWMPKAGYNTLVIPMNYQGHGRVKWGNWREQLTPELQKRDITIEVGGHGYQNFLNADMEDGKLFDRHPEWFGLDKSRKRRREIGYAFCTSNPQAVAYLIDNFVKYIQAHPEIQIYDFWPPDSARWCECDACKKLGEPADRQALLIRQIRQRVEPLIPNLKFEIIAYSTYIAPPAAQSIDQEILVDFCPIAQQFTAQIDDPHATTNAKYVANLRAWRSRFTGDISIYSYYRKYAWNSLPVIIPHYLQNDLRFYLTIPVQGVSTYCEPADWATYELNHYALARLARDPDLNIDELIKSFCDARYGTASEKAMIAIKTLEDTTRQFNSIPYTPMPGVDELSKAIARIENAKAQLPEDGPSHRLQLMLEYSKRDLEIQKLRAAKAPADEIAEQVKLLADFLKSNADAGVFLVNDRRLSEASLMKHYSSP